MKIIQTTLTRTSSGEVLVHGSNEDKNLDCIVAHLIAPTYMKVREIAEAPDALADPAKALDAIREAFRNPMPFKPELDDHGLRVQVPVPGDGRIEAGSPLAPPSRPVPIISNPEIPAGFGRILSHQESADGHFPEYRVLLERARAALEEDGRMRGECPLLDDIDAVLAR